MKNFQERIEGLIWTAAVGDALGVPVECKSAEEIRESFGFVREFRDPSAHIFFPGALKGSYSDDTQNQIALIDSLVEARGFDLNVIAAGKIAAFNESSQGWGGTTKESLQRIIDGVDPLEAGKTDKPNRGLGNGVAMYIAALALYAKAIDLPKAEIIDLTIKLSIMTHATSLAVSSGLAQVAAAMYCLDHDQSNFNHLEFIEQIMEFSAIGREILVGDSSANLNQRLSQLSSMLNAEDQEIIDKFGAGSCYVFDSLPFAYAFFLRNPFSIETLFQVVNAGGDTDTNAAICGALLGALNGIEILPKDLREGVQNGDRIQNSIERFKKTFIC
jgi:ADP-ribosylglycohydrolase